MVPGVARGGTASSVQHGVLQGEIWRVPGPFGPGALLFGLGEEKRLADRKTTWAGLVKKLTRKSVLNAFGHYVIQVPSDTKR